MMTLFQNNVMFRNPMAPTDSPKMLFYRIEQCQEIQSIEKLPYSKEQIITNAAHILIQANIFPLEEFDSWEAMTPKTYPALKTFIHEAYSNGLTVMALCSTSGQNGYGHQTIYNVMEAGIDDNTDNDMVTSITQTAAFTAATGNMTPSSRRDISAKVAAAINHFSANQTAIMSQMTATSAQKAAMSFVPPLAQHTHAFVPHEPFSVLPIQQVAVPMQRPFAATGIYNAGCGGQHGGCGRSRGGGRGGRSHTPFADAMCGRGAASAMTNLVLYRGGITQLPAAPGVQQQCRNLDFSNIYKVHNNWNVCFQCGFDIKDGHMPIMGLFKKWNHKDSFMRENALQFIAAGYDLCTKGMHKTVLPSKRNA
jgi:hypothetical protein